MEEEQLRTKKLKGRGFHRKRVGLKHLSPWEWKQVYFDLISEEQLPGVVQTSPLLASPSTTTITESYPPVSLAWQPLSWPLSAAALPPRTLSSRQPAQPRERPPGPDILTAPPASPSPAQLAGGSADDASWPATLLKPAEMSECLEASAPVEGKCNTPGTKLR